MNTGQYISAGAHLGLVAYVLLGGFFLSPKDSEPVHTQEVSLISESDFASLSRVETSPEVPNEAPEVTAPEVSTPEPTPPAPSEPAAAPPAPAEPAPEVDVTPAPNLAPSPDPEISLEDPGAGLPDIAGQRPTPRPVPRIAPEAVVNPEKTPEIADQVVPETSPDAAPAAEPVPEEPAAAPQEAVTEIVTEAETPSGMTQSPRPKSRPAAAARQVAEQKAQEDAAQQADDQAQRNADAAAKAAADAAAALAAESVSGTPAAPSRPAGPPLSAGEKDALRVAVSQCWNTGSMSTEAQRTTVTVGLSMNPDGTPQAGSLKLLSSSGGSSAAAEQAFQTARRAIIICGKRGFPLPADKFDQWSSIEMTFDPEQMRFK
ncbi:cell division and transport-associated protein TolA [Pacificibacter maritimus]|uniref:Cell division and transport-associated protein TolA n=1 Tax=Pacificibacter maritimus TaxID=762213 RepID=A0A3N4UZS0_9RHOB|nr:energy transducer TonB [Pacificibacter maritimus]RPE67090.1 cell division and transport-associated protein TolA [Pacificibacter maritimus]